jgi:DNA-binding winged helix-turn-helix (wHTH) protein
MNPLFAWAKPRCQPNDRCFSVAHRTAPTDTTLEFGRFRVLLRERRLLAGGAPVELGARGFDILIVLIEADGALVTKDELQRRVWPGVVVAPDNLKVQIFTLRKALGKDRELVRTEHGRGYRFTAAVNRLGSDRNERRRGPHYHAGHSGRRARRSIRFISPGSGFSEILLDPAC